MNPIKNNTSATEVESVENNVSENANANPANVNVSTMSLFSTVNQKPYLGFSNLPKGFHEIQHFRLVKNNYYNPDCEKLSLKRVLLVELKDQVLFLPEYFAIKFNDDDNLVNALNNDGIKKFLFFNGKKPGKW